MVSKSRSVVVWGVGKVRGRNYSIRELLEVMALFITVMVTPGVPLDLQFTFCSFSYLRSLRSETIQGKIPEINNP